ncbi:D-glycero-beta-D-manno-heptose 1-phosphate adenylyltransferase [Epidermidibacterium keratini]|uniref:D-glycero-beta-D-manno-heptose 1-phosphate adenylyltransferase n=1 Tax=Epidermidibacterium keratini TaxID=1891644 RepID=A0A7L4YML8_9ACTN|nr:D-glycero-beta-D-manno-heptose 1-phosphate adenylyltransferase [Epidermidibacterium keratini]QHC00396.1 D-glycero-beta-D-manno-heptose 1-phosphate adenylyltransferase [Epidermidibacterium keratini]
MSRLVIVGESMLDIDLNATAGRLSPDAPVPVLDDPQEHDRPGGAALAALLAATEGAEVTLVTPLADDPAGARVTELLHEAGVTVIATQQRDGTPVKQRIRANGQVIARIDRGGGAQSWTEVPAAADEALAQADAVLVSDYGRGMTLDPLVRELLETAEVPLVWDPHRSGGDPVRGTVVCTPNEHEFADSGDDASDLVALAARRPQWLRGSDAPAAAVTVGGRGAVLITDDSAPLAFPTAPVRGNDTCGAGDRFAGALAIALADGNPLSQAVAHAVRRASDYVARGGAAGLRERSQAPAEGSEDAVALAERVRRDGGTVVATGGCFDVLHAGHVATLEGARQLGDCLIVCVNSDSSVRRLKGPDRPVVAEADRARVLRSLHCVDAVLIFDEDTPTEALRTLRPHIWTKGGDYADHELTERTALAEWGGETFVLPFLEGRSTTRILGSIRGATAPATDQRKGHVL